MLGLKWEDPELMQWGDKDDVLPGALIVIKSMLKSEAASKSSIVRSIVCVSYVRTYVYAWQSMTQLTQLPAAPALRLQSGDPFLLSGWSRKSIPAFGLEPELDYRIRLQSGS